MKIILLGTGGPKPDPNRQGPCLVIQTNNQNILFDAGRGAGTQLVRAGLAIDRINPIFITHHHYDHIGNLGDLILSSWNLGRKEQLSIFGPEGTLEIVDVLLNHVYKRDIDFRLAEAAISGVTLKNIDSIVKAEDISPGLVYENNGVKIYADYVKHGHGLRISQDSWKCLGYRIEAEGKIITISGDTVGCKGLAALAKDSDVLVLCCYLSAKELEDAEGDLIAKHILTCSPQAGTIARKANVKKLILTHFREKSNQAIKEVVLEIGADFNGEVIPGCDLSVINI
jgi:ribonuclease Z